MKSFAAVAAELAQEVALGGPDHVGGQGFRLRHGPAAGLGPRALAQIFVALDLLERRPGARRVEHRQEE
jgi:hypothetical protein